jgi:hypothetical protein
MAPFVSRKQARFAFTPKGLQQFGGKKVVEEYASKTDYTKLPERKMKRIRKHCKAKK